MRISAVLITRKEREGNVGKIMESIRACPDVDEVEVLVDNPRRVYGRYLAALKVKNDAVYVQDDDCLVDVERVCRNYARDPGYLAAAIASTHFRWLLSQQWGHAQLGMVGWGAVFDRRWIRPAFDAYFRVYPPSEPAELGFVDREADRLFTILIDRPHQLWSVEVQHLDGFSGEEAMYREPTHWQTRELAIHRALAVLSKTARPCAEEERG